MSTAVGVYRCPERKRLVVLFDDYTYTGFIPFDWFEANPTAKPDFGDIEVIDEGQTLRLGEYEVAIDTIRKEFGP